MDTLNDDCKNTIFKYIHQMKFRTIINDLNKSADMWCEQQLQSRYCKARHIYAYNKCLNEFKDLNDYEGHLFIYFNFFDLD